jgi:hypothetical protein
VYLHLDPIFYSGTGIPESENETHDGVTKKKKRGTLRFKPTLHKSKRDGCDEAELHIHLVHAQGLSGKAGHIDPVSDSLTTAHFCFGLQPSICFCGGLMFILGVGRMSHRYTFPCSLIT